MATKKRELKPEAFEKIETDLSKKELETLENLKESLQNFDVEVESEGKEETFYKLAIKELFSNDKIETKTEFLHTGEVFTATKLQFLGKYGNIPLLSDFIDAFQRKRISLNRKGREEIIMSLQERRQEEMEIRKQQMLGLGFFK